jgi:hypothetical protein
MSVANTWYTGPAILLPPGTWMISATATIQRTSNGIANLGWKIHSDTNAFAQSQQTVLSNNPNTTNMRAGTIAVLSAQTGITASALTDNATNYLLHRVTIQPTGSNATSIYAIKVA